MVYIKIAVGCPIIQNENQNITFPILEPGQILSKYFVTATRGI